MIFPIPLRGEEKGKIPIPLRGEKGLIYRVVPPLRYAPFLRDVRRDGGAGLTTPHTPLRVAALALLPFRRNRNPNP